MKGMNIRMKKRIISIILVLTVIAALTGYDFYRSKQIVITVENRNSNIVDSSIEAVELVLCVKSRTGKVIEGHNIYALSIGGGSFKAFYQKTDQNGNVTFLYYPPKLAGYQDKKDVTLRFRDESNSVFIEIYPSTEYEITIKDFKNNNETSVSVSDFLK